MLNIDKILNEAPALIAKSSEDALRAKTDYNTRTEDYKNNEARFRLKAKAENPELKDYELKAMVEADNSLSSQRMELICAESGYKRAEIDVLKWQEALNSAKVLARIKIAEMSNLDVTVKK